MHSTGAQLGALYDGVKVDVWQDPAMFDLRIEVRIRHRQREYRYGSAFDIYMFMGHDGGFYKDYIRTEFPRLVAREVNDIIMRAAL